MFSLRPCPIDFNEIWTPIQRTVIKILNLEFVSKDEWGDRFHDIYKLCVAHPDRFSCLIEPYSDRAYQETKKLIKVHVQSNSKQILQYLDSPELLSVYHEKWCVFKKAIDYLSILYIYLNTQYVRKFRNYEVDEKNDEKLMEINELGSYIWKTEVITIFQSKLVALLLKAIDDDRRGVDQNHKVIQEIVDSFIAVEDFGNRGNKSAFYKEYFEKQLLHSTKIYYTNRAKILLKDNDCSQYLEKVLNTIEVERKLLNKLIPAESHTKVIHVLEKCMCRLMVKAESNQDLRNMFLLLKPVESGLKIMINQIESHIQEKGIDIIKWIINSKDENQIHLFVEEILKVYYHFSKIITELFNGDRSFISALDRACTNIINYRENSRSPCKSPEILSRYCDNLLKKSSKNITDKDMERKINDAIIIFKYINDKDVFQKCYAKMLAKRLIHSQCTSMENEECMIQKIKAVCGYEFTSKLQRMFTDVKVCDDFMVGFQKHLLNSNIKFPMSFHAYILQACAWPFSQTPVSSFNIPICFEKAVNEFENFYLNKFNGRKLNWIFNVSQGEVKFLFTKKTYHVTMNTFQIAIILSFEHSDEVSYAELKKLTNLNDEQLQRHIQSFLDLKILLIANDIITNDQSQTPQQQQPSTSGIHCPSKISNLNNNNNEQANSGDLSFIRDKNFLLNLNFVGKRMKFKVNVPPPKDVQQKEQVEHHIVSVEEDRKMFLQAAIVRIMKTRKKLRQNPLIEEVICQAQHRFIPNVVMIKKAIESLIEKQYIERIDNGDEYQYMA
ncbi:cullin-2-like protein [Sarcoptes scabiei]|uniref:Cullin-2 n=1 Tax=Sarcoptes scabiei TaxID=52283 RepID=A0A132A7S8_SARSC|nr:cullin-2-like protein [Sarcoptes scabiei]